MVYGLKLPVSPCMCPSLSLSFNAPLQHTQKPQQPWPSPLIFSLLSLPLLLSTTPASCPLPPWGKKDKVMKINIEKWRWKRGRQRELKWTISFGHEPLGGCGKRLASLADNAQLCIRHYLASVSWLLWQAITGKNEERVMQVCLCVTGGYLPLGSSGIDIALLTFLVHSDDTQTHTDVCVYACVSWQHA